MQLAGVSDLVKPTLMLYHSERGVLYCRFEGDFLTGLSVGENRFKDISDYNTSQSFKEELDQYFEGRLSEFRQRIKFTEGTEFHKRVWSCVKTVGYGQLVSYKDIAEKLNTKGYQAVGCAIAKNPILIVVPCHRVVGLNGSLKGFSAGIELKSWLINHEHRHSGVRAHQLLSDDLRLTL